MGLCSSGIECLPDRLIERVDTISQTGGCGRYRSLSCFIDSGDKAICPSKQELVARGSEGSGFCQNPSGSWQVKCGSHLVLASGHSW